MSFAWCLPDSLDGENGETCSGWIVTVRTPVNDNDSRTVRNRIAMGKAADVVRVVESISYGLH